MIKNKIDSLSTLISPRKDIHRPVYNWHSFKHSYSKELVDNLIKEFQIKKGAWVMDSFCGGGTTLLACKEAGINSAGFDILPFSVFLSNVKTRNYSIEELRNEKAKFSVPTHVSLSIPALTNIPIAQKAFTRDVRTELIKIKQRVEEINNKDVRDFYNLGLLSILESVSNTTKSGGFLRLIERKVNSNTVSKLFNSQTSILDYELNIVLLADVEVDEELNLQFLRLQIGAALNAGEKLNAMTGEMRDVIFTKIKDLSFFDKIKIQKRRFAREQIAAQIILNVFSKKENGEFHKSRYVDLQDFFKTKEKFSKEDNKTIREIETNINIIEKKFGDKLRYINNRALAVSVYLFISELIEQKKENDIEKFSDFFVTFMKTLKWQIPKGIDMNTEYRELLSFQTNISQAAGEKTAIQKRHDFLKEYFYYYKQSHHIKGDDNYKKANKKDPDTERNKIRL